MTKEKTKNSEEKAIEFEVCNSCNFKDEHKCPQHGAYLIVNDRPLPLKLPGRARSSLPHMFDIRPSPVHGEGVFAENKLPPRMRFGPYEGTKVSRQQAEEDSTYVFSVSWRRKTIFIDARDESRANWMRFVNCSRTKGEANLHAIQDRGRVYYWTCRVVDPGEELLVWYGDVYARELGLLDDGDSAQSEEESSDEYESEKGLKRKSEDEHKSDGSKRCKTNGTISNSTDFERHEAASVRLDVNGDDGSLNGKDGNRAARKRTASEETDTASSEGEANVTGRSGTIGKKTETALVDDFLSDRNRAVEHRIGATRKRSVLREIVIDDVGNTGQANGDRIGTASKRTASKVADAAGVCCVEEIDADGRSVGASSRNGQIGAESDVVFLGEENGSGKDIEVLSFADPSDVIVTKVDLQKKRFNLSRGRRTASTKTAPENLNLSTDSEIIELETKVNKKSGDSSKAVEKTKLPNESSSEENSEAANPKRKQNTEENHGKIINLTSNGEGDLVISGRRKTKRGQDSEMAEKQAENHWDKHRKLVKAVRKIAQGHQMVADGWKMLHTVCTASGCGDIPGLLRDLKPLGIPSFGNVEVEEAGSSRQLSSDPKLYQPLPIRLNTEGPSSYEYGCRLCDIAPMRKRGMEAHIRSVHTKQCLYCDVCDFSTYNMDSLLYHSKRHK